ncbi:hypothetical protein ACN47A_10230 [Myxococcus fulvus]|uniref:hypothetical protein n=1 Tax=Myxococcus fulvus TaxID=33 RepID=UPI003B9C71C3
MRLHLRGPLVAACLAFTADAGPLDTVSREPSLDYPGCDLEYSDHDTPWRYEGFSTERPSCREGTATLFVTFLHEVPARITVAPFHAHSVGKLGLDGQPLRPAPLHVQELDTFVNPWGVSMKRYRVTVSSTLLDQEHCAALTFTAAYQLATDCGPLPIIKVSPRTASLTPAAYKVSSFVAASTSSGGLHTFKATPASPPCSGCHEPALGPSPLHVFEYRLRGSATWLSVTRTDALDFEVQVSTAGLHEFRSKGRLAPDGTFSGYSPVSFVYVP